MQFAGIVSLLIDPAAEPRHCLELTMGAAQTVRQARRRTLAGLKTDAAPVDQVRLLVGIDPVDQLDHVDIEADAPHVDAILLGGGNALQTIAQIAHCATFRCGRTTISTRSTLPASARNAST